MAEVTVRVKFNTTYTIDCKGTTPEECMDDIVDRDLLIEKVADDIYESMSYVSGTFDEDEDGDIEDTDEDEGEGEDGLQG